MTATPTTPANPHRLADTVQIGDHVYLSGLVSADAEMNVVGGASVVAQLAHAYAHVERTLAEFGSTLEDVVEETAFVTDMNVAMDSLDSINTVREQVFGGPPAVDQNVVEVSQLTDPALMVEIRCVARVGEARSGFAVPPSVHDTTVEPHPPCAAASPLC